jgi:hypothetical protein
MLASQVARVLRYLERYCSSVDVHFGPKAPDGGNLNWVPTVAGGGFEVLFRLYGPEKSFFEKK